MTKLSPIPRISLGLTILVILPWSVVILTSVRVSFLDELPALEPADASEVVALAYAMRTYKNRYGEYPPDFTSGNPRQEIDDHLALIFPLRDKEQDVPPGIYGLGPDNALAFWLQGFYTNNARFPLTGKISLGKHPATGKEVFFSGANRPVQAMVYDGNNVAMMTADGNVTRLESSIEIGEEFARRHRQVLQRLPELLERRALYVFRIKRLDARQGYRTSCSDAPLVYFNSTNYDRAKFISDKLKWGIARPYLSSELDFAQPDGIQIICAGRDDFFGTDTPVIAGVTRDGHADNFTSFSREPLGFKVLSSRHRTAIAQRNLSPLVALVLTMLYPVVLVCRAHEDGKIVLARLIANQMAAVDCSDQWRRLRDSQRRVDRQHAIRRMSARSDDGENGLERQNERQSRAKQDVS